MEPHALPPTWSPPYCGLGPGGAHAPLDLISHIDPQVGVGCVEPTGLLLLLLLGMLQQGGHWGAILLKYEGCDSGWDLHLTFVFGFLLNNGVSVWVACSVTLKRTETEPLTVGNMAPTHISHTYFDPLLSEGLSLTQKLRNTMSALLLLWCVSELFPSPGPPTSSFSPTSPLIRAEKIPRTLQARQTRLLTLTVLQFSIYSRGPGPWLHTGILRPPQSGWLPGERGAIWAAAFLKACQLFLTVNPHFLDSKASKPFPSWNPEAWLRNIPVS